MHLWFSLDLGSCGTSVWLNERGDVVITCHFKLDALYQLQLQMASGNTTVFIFFDSLFHYYKFFIYFFHIFFFVLYCKCFFYIMVLLLSRKYTFENPFAQNFFRYTDLCICTGLPVFRGLFFFLNLSFVTFFISNCWYLPHLIQRCYVAQLLFCTEQVRSIHLFCSSKNRHVGKKKWKLRQTSDDRTEKSVEYMCDRSCIVLRLTTVVWTEMSEYRCIYEKKKNYSTWYFFMFYCKHHFIFLLLLKRK